MTLSSNFHLDSRGDISVNPEVKQGRSEEIEQKWPHVQSMAQKIENSLTVKTGKPLRIASIPRKSIGTTGQVSHSLKFFEKNAEEMKNHVVEEKKSIIEEKEGVVKAKNFPVSKRSSVEGKRSVGRGSSLPKNFTLALKEFEKSTDAKNKVLSEIFFNEEKVLPVEQEVELPPSEGTYVEQLKKLQEEGKTLQPAPLYRFLLRPEQEQFREDFLIAGPWMNFVKEDRSLAAKGEKPILVKEMEKLFEKGSPEQEELILKFAIRLIENGIFSKEVFQNGILNKKHMLELMDIPEVSGFNELINQFINAEPMPLERAEDIKYTVEHSGKGALVNCLQELSKWKVSGKSDAAFIREFADDLTTLSSNNLKHVHHSEFYGQAYTKEINKAPNLTYITSTFNQISFFLADQILQLDNPKERVRLYSALIQIAHRLIEKNHDFQNAFALLATLNNAAVTAIIDKDRLKEKHMKSLEDLDKLFDTRGNYKNLNERLQTLSKVSYIPFIGFTTRDFTFTDDGNPNPDPTEKKINFDRMELLARTHRQIKEKQGKLTEQRKLHFDLKKEIIQVKIRDDDARWDRVNEIKSRKKK